MLMWVGIHEWGLGGQLVGETNVKAPEDTFHIIY